MTKYRGEVALSGLMPKEVNPLTQVVQRMDELAVDSFAIECLEPPSPPLMILAGILRSLTYGEMVEFARGIDHDPAKIHAWAASK